MVFKVGYTSEFSLDFSSLLLTTTKEIDNLKVICRIKKSIMLKYL